MCLEGRKWLVLFLCHFISWSIWLFKDLDLYRISERIQLNFVISEVRKLRFSNATVWRRIQVFLRLIQEARHCIMLLLIPISCSWDKFISCIKSYIKLVIFLNILLSLHCKTHCLNLGISIYLSVFRFYICKMDLIIIMWMYWVLIICQVLF